MAKSRAVKDSMVVDPRLFMMAIYLEGIVDSVGIWPCQTGAGNSLAVDEMRQRNSLV